MSLIPFSEKIEFSQQFDIKIVDREFCLELSQDRRPKSCFCKIVNYQRIQQRLNIICHLLSVYVVSLYLNIDRQFKYCSHFIKIIWYSAFVLKDSSGEEKHLPSAPVSFTRVKVNDLNLSLCSPFSNNRFRTEK